MVGNRQVGQYKFLEKHQEKIKSFKNSLRETDVYLDKAKDFGEMYNFLIEQQLGNGSDSQPLALKSLDIWHMAAEWWLWKHDLKYPCYYCKYWKHTKYMYGVCTDNDMEDCHAEWDFCTKVKKEVDKNK